MENLSELENTLLGATASFCQAIILQPTIYWKNASQQKLPFTLNPRVVYRGIGAALTNEMGQMAFQYAATGYIKKLVCGGKKITPVQEVSSALLGGVVVAPFANVAECIMIQQQRVGGTLLSTAMRIPRDFGTAGLFRGLMPCAIRDGIYVAGLLGLTPACQDYLMKKQDFSQASAGFWASLLGGAIVGVVTCPFDAMSTCMKGDLTRETFGGFLDTCTRQAKGGLGTLFGGVFWRTVNITGTIYIANEARVRLGPLMFPDKY